MWEFATQGHGIVSLCRSMGSWFVGTIDGIWNIEKRAFRNQVFEVEIYRVTVTITPKMNGILDSQTSTPT